MLKIVLATICALGVVTAVHGQTSIKLDIKVSDAKPTGALVEEVTKGGTAAKMKLEVGDKIIRLNDTKVPDSNYLVTELKKATSVEIIWRSKSSGKCYQAKAAWVTTTPQGKPPETILVVEKRAEVKPPKD